MAGADVSHLSEGFDNYIQTEILGDDFDRENNFVHFPFQSLSDIHLKSDLQMDVPTNGDIRYVYLFGLIGFLILALACINFTNLSTARSLIRAKEVGMRKMLGSGKKQIVWQFFLEAFIHVIIATLIALIMIGFILPYFSTFTQKNLFIDLKDPTFYYWIVGFMILTLSARWNHPRAYHFQI